MGDDLGLAQLGLGAHLIHSAELDSSILSRYEVRDFAPHALIEWGRSAQQMPGVAPQVLQRMLRQTKEEIIRLPASMDRRREELQIKALMLEELLPKPALPKPIESPLPLPTTRSAISTTTTITATTTTTTTGARASESLSAAQSRPPAPTSRVVSAVTRSVPLPVKSAHDKALRDAKELKAEKPKAKKPKAKKRKASKAPSEAAKLASKRTRRTSGKERVVSDPLERAGSSNGNGDAAFLETASCPVCGRDGFSIANSADNLALNKHIDRCLSRPPNALALRDSLENSRETESGAESESLSSSMSTGSSGEELEEEEEEPRLLRTPPSRTSTPLGDSLDDDWFSDLADARIAAYNAREVAWGKAWQAALDEGLSEADAFARAELVEASPCDALQDMHEEQLVSEMDDGTVLPTRLFQQLLPYQREAVQWLASLRNKGGGILGDEMGLGKTVEIIAFLASLQTADKLTGPVLLVVPATTLSQWVAEMRRWYAPLRVFMLHVASRSHLRGWTPQSALARAFDDGAANVVLTTYEGLRTHKTSLLIRDWDTVVLDEGHRIRNPDADVTQTAKSLRSVNRIVATGAPIQNNLRELWSLFDFCFPGLLGILPTFQSEFEDPIKEGGFAKSSARQVQYAYQRALALRQTVAPYLLRRLKKDVAQHLPTKTEQVLMCNLTEAQKREYSALLARDDVRKLLGNERYRRQSGAIFKVITALQKICNHPDLFLLGPIKSALAEDDESNGNSGEEDVDDGETDLPDGDFDASRSGKMLVLQHVLVQWRQEKRKCLVFCQGTQMLDVLQRFLKALRLPAMRMDGSTALSRRQTLIDEFNSGDPEDVFCFLLTTRVGGVGVNLTGATRVVLFDPTWNPSVDINARERAWRLGQTKEVCVYRFLTCGTIEEKIYHRQVYKQFLTNKVLVDPRQRRMFKLDDLHDLFSFDDSGQDQTETAELFSEGRVEAPEDGSLLSKLFDADLREAISHDAVEAASSTEPEAAFLRREAEAAARRAANRLREETRRLRAAASVQEPSWTGTSGIVGAPLRGSALLLQRLRQAPGTPAPSTALHLANGSAAAGEDKEFMVCRELRDYLRSGKRASKDLVERFKTSSLDAMTFKEVLHALAEVDSRGYWKLKDEY